MHLKWKMSVRVLTVTASEISSPFYSVASQRQPWGILDFVWFNANRWMRNFPPPPPSPRVTRPFFPPLCHVGWALSLRGIVFCLRSPSSASLCCKKACPPPTERSASSPSCLSVFIILRNFCTFAPAASMKQYKKPQRLVAAAAIQKHWSGVNKDGSIKTFTTADDDSAGAHAAWRITQSEIASIDLVILL